MFQDSSRQQPIAVWDPTLRIWTRPPEPDSFFALLEPFSVTWPASGSMRSGRVWQRPTGGAAISGSGSSSSRGLPTPRARDWKHGGKDGLHEALQMLPTPRATDGTKGGPNQRGSKGDLMLPSAVAQLLPTPRTSDSNGGGQHGDGGLDLRTAVGQLASDADGEPRGEWGNAASGEAQGGGASAVDCGCDRASWGKYASAVHRWERVIGRAAPAPVDERGRLAPLFVEWMMGLDEGRVTGVAGLSRAQMLKALGNGVMPQQGTAALAILRDRMRAALLAQAA